MEINVLKILKSNYIPELYEVCLDHDQLYMVMENAGKRTLKSFILKYESQISVKIIFRLDILKKCLLKFSRQ